MTKRQIAHLISSSATMLLLALSVATSRSGDQLVWSFPFMLANGMQLLFLAISLRQRPRDLDESWPMFLVSLGGAASPVLVPLLAVLFSPESRNPALAGAGRWLNLVVMPFYLVALWNLGKRLTVLPEAISLQTGGIYAISRHPLYFSYMYWFAVQNLIFQSWAVAVFSVVQCALMVIRAAAEERVLSDCFAEYAEYKRNVWWIGARWMIPGSLRNWTRRGVQTSVLPSNTGE